MNLNRQAREILNVRLKLLQKIHDSNKIGMTPGPFISLVNNFILKLFSSRIQSKICFNNCFPYELKYFFCYREKRDDMFDILSHLNKAISKCC